MSRTRHHGDKKKEKLFGSNWLWYAASPKRWRKEYKHKPQRAATRQAEHKALMGECKDDIEFPLDRKPYEYYY